MVDFYLAPLYPLISLTSVAVIVDWWQVCLEKDRLDYAGGFRSWI
ncbi:MAG TPA: hypothetical protein VLH18_02780 [Candidatus Limnocylindrales bacterium]|nr:hypothetical protein [Candidatus Limnocylindrales bacterium]